LPTVSAALQPLQRVHDEDPEDVEHHQRHRVVLPRHLVVGRDAEHAVEQPLERTEQALRDPRVARVHARHVRTERDAERDQHDRVEHDLADAGGGHCSRSGWNSATSR